MEYGISQIFAINTIKYNLIGMAKWFIDSVFFLIREFASYVKPFILT